MVHVKEKAWMIVQSAYVLVAFERVEFFFFFAKN